MEHPNHYDGKEVVVLGLARSGRAAALLLHSAGAIVTVNDLKAREHFPEAEELEARGIKVICGHHPQQLLHQDVALVIKNPGIPYTAPPVLQALDLGIEVVTEVEVAYKLAGSRIIGITGSNGKTTTTTWVGELMKKAGMMPVVAGNIGIPLCEAVQVAEHDQWLITELSSFQLKGVSQFRPQISCLLNVCETHLDYHQTLEDYIASKMKLFSNQTAEDVAVLNWDDPICRLAAQQIDAQVMAFSMKEELQTGVFVKHEQLQQARTQRWIVYRDREQSDHPLVKVEELGIPGEYNIENALAAAAIAIQAGAPLEAIRLGLRSFRGVEHRLEFVRSLHDISYYNNSKATNSLATIKALEAFDQSIVLIAGGLDRGADYMELLPQFKDKVKGLVLFGETSAKLRKVGELAGISFIEVVNADTDANRMIDQAVKRASHMAASGDVVLLSPACASWDMFESYEERGRMFKESVHNL